MQVNQKKAGVIVSYLAQAVHIITGFIYTPVMIRLLGQSEYGLYQLVYSVVSYLSLLSLGFGSSYMRFYAREKSKGNKDGVGKLNGMFLLIFITFSIICIICGFFMIKNIRAIFGSGLLDAEYSLARILMALLVINLALTFPNSVFNCIITSQERFLFQKTLILIHYILNPVIALPLLIMGFGSIGMVTVTTLLTLAVLITNIYYCLVQLKTKFIFHDLQFSLLKEMTAFTFFIFLNQIIDQINLSVDKFLLGRLAGTTSVAVYGVGSQINSLYSSLSSSVSAVFVPKVNQLVAKGNRDKELTNLFIKVGRIQYIILALIVSGFVFYGKTFIYYWAGSEYGDSYYVALLLMIPITVPLIQNLGIEIQRAKNKHKARSIVYFIIALANVLISIPLIKLYGAVGATIGTAISLVGGNWLFMNWYYQTHLSIDIKLFWKNILSITRSFVPAIIFGVICLLFFNKHSIFLMLIEIVLYTIIYAVSVFCFGMVDSEKKEVTSSIRKIKSALKFN